MIDSQRRKLIKGSLALGLLPLGLSTPIAKALPTSCTIPNAGETLNPIGMGTWITFNVGRDNYLRKKRTQVLKTFFQYGGQMIDSSPMYGSSEQVVGFALSQLKNKKSLFSATKTWTNSADEGRKQFSDSQQFWNKNVFDLVQVHNLVAWREQLAMLRELRQEGLVRYLGVTTSHGRRHEELLHILQTEPLDFIQLTYNIFDREAEQKLLPLAKEKGIAVIANRPLRGGSLMDSVANTPLPPWHAELGCYNWSQFFLRFIISHPALTCAIPATTRVDHMVENMQSVNTVPLPDEKLRTKMINYWASR